MNKLMGKLKEVNYNAVVFAAFLSIFTITYMSFTQYKPKVLAEVREVKGARIKTSSVPIPQAATIISDTAISSDVQQMTLKTNESAQQINDFYYNVFLAKSWRIDKEGVEGEFYTTKYRKDDAIVYISTSEQNVQNGEIVTIVTIEIVNNN